jgi:long-chain fatty acid transport protein
MRNVSRLGAALALLIAAGPALATNGMRMTGFGPVQNSMGGTGVGATLDANAVVSNPAGLSELGARLDVGATWFKPTVEYRATESQLPPGFGGAVVAQPDATISSKRGGSFIPAVAVSLPMSPDWTFGLGLTGTAGMGVDYPANLYGGRTLSSYMQARLAPGLAWKLAPSLSLGVALNVMMAQMRFDVAGGLGQQPHDTATSYGYGLTVGLKFRPIEQLAIGLAYETKSTFQQFTFKIPAHGGVDPATFAPVQLPGGEDRLRFDQPPVLTLGIAVTPWEALVLAADLEWIRWTETNGRDQPEYTAGAAYTGSLPWNLNWSDQLVLKIGAQVQATKALKIRAGYNYGKMPLDPDRAFENIAFPAIAEYHLSLGAGYDVTPAVTILAGLTYSPKATLQGRNPLYPAQGGQAIASYQSKMSQIAVDLGASWRF